MVGESRFDRVAGIISDATVCTDANQTLEYLKQVRELIINFDSALLDSFFEDVVAFQSRTNSDIKRFVVQFIQDACLVDGSFIGKSVPFLSHLLLQCLHAERVCSSVIRVIVAAVTSLYGRALSRAVRLGFIESGAVSGGGIEEGSLADASLEAFRSISALKDEVLRFLLPLTTDAAVADNSLASSSSLNVQQQRIYASLSDSVRVEVVKLVEAMVVQQSSSAGSAAVAEKEVSLDAIPDMPNRLLTSVLERSTAPSAKTPLPGICLVRPRRLADEAERLLAELAKLLLSRQTSSASVFPPPISITVFNAVVIALVNIAKRRPQFVMNVLQTLETVHVNLPAHFAGGQVRGARGAMKTALLSLLRNTMGALSAEQHGRVAVLLSDLGATHLEISNAMKDAAAAKAEAEATDSPSSLSSRKRVIEESQQAQDEDEEEEEEVGAFRGRHARPTKRPRTASAGAVSGNSDTPSLRVEEVASGLVAKLTPANVADLVLLSMLSLPSSMPPAFHATYTPIASAGTSVQVRHLARLLASSFVVWAGESAQNEALLRGLVGLKPAVAASAEAEEWEGKRRTEVGRRRSTITINEEDDDEEAFIREHTARMYTSSKPMNISVVQGVAGAVGAEAAEGEQTVSPSPVLLGVPPPPPTSATGVTTSSGRPFDLDALTSGAVWSEAERQMCSEQAMQRILVALATERRTREEAAEEMKEAETTSPGTLARLKLVARVVLAPPPSTRMLNAVIEYAMSNLKENFELLISLLYHAYEGSRGFWFHCRRNSGTKGPAGQQVEKCDAAAVEKSSVAVGGSSSPSAECVEDEAIRLLLESQRQLEALRSLKPESEQTPNGEPMETSKKVGRRRSSMKWKGEAVEERRWSSPFGGAEGDDEAEEWGTMRVFSGVYEAVLGEIMARFASSGVEAPYFGRMLLETPVLTPSAISVLQSYCIQPEHSEYGFQVLRSLIQMHPNSNRGELLDLLLAFCAHEDSGIRETALKAACQLADSSKHWESVVEERAAERMKRILEPVPTPELFADLLTAPPGDLPSQWTEETCRPCSHLFLGLVPRNPDKLLFTLANIYVASSDTVRRCILRLVDTTARAIGLHSPALLRLLESCPEGAEALVTRMVAVLTVPESPAPANGSASASSGFKPPIMPPAEVVDRMRRLWRARVVAPRSRQVPGGGGGGSPGDVRCLLPVLVGLSKSEVISLLPRIVQLPDRVVKEVISRLLHASVATQPAPDPRDPNSPASTTPTPLGPLTPEELLVAIHLLEFVKAPSDSTSPEGSKTPVKAKDEQETPEGSKPKKPYVEMRVILAACMHCFAERALFTQERLSAVIGQLLDCSPVVPTLFLRTVMQALALYPRLSGYVVDVLARLIQKQVWKTSVLWTGFIRCCVKTQPASYAVLLQLPPAQLEAVFASEPALRASVRRHVETFSAAQRTHIARGIFAVLERRDNAPSTQSAPAAAAEETTQGGGDNTAAAPAGGGGGNNASGSGTPLRDEVAAEEAEEKTRAASEGATAAETPKPTLLRRRSRSPFAES